MIPFLTTAALCGALAGLLLWLVNEYVLRVLAEPMPWEHHD